MLRSRSVAIPFFLSTTFLIACGRETAAPDAPAKTTTTSTATTSTAAAPPAPPPVALPAVQTYDGAVQWYGRTRGFHFSMKSAEFDIAGQMERTRPGAERVRFKHAGQEWLGAAERTGIVWYKRSGGSWTKAAPPPFADMAYQRATLWFDPQKKEGEAQKSGERAYQFTDANTGGRYDIALDAQGRIASLEVSEPQRFSMTITKADEAAAIE